MYWGTSVLLLVNGWSRTFVVVLKGRVSKLLWVVGLHVGFHNEVCHELGLIEFGSDSGDHSLWVL